MITISFTFRRSRWNYGGQYAVFFILLVSSLWLNDRALDFAARICGTLAAILLITLETLIRYERITLAETDLELKRGIRSVDITRIPYHDIAHVEVLPSTLSGIFHYGTLNIHTKEQTITTFAVDEPSRVKELIFERKQTAR